MQEKVKHRIALSTVFFLGGLIFATLASRIPTIKELFELNEAQLGSLLLVMPISSLLGLPLSGWLVDKYESRKPLLMGGLMICVFIGLLGFMPTVIWYGVGLFLFSFFNRILNISMNTQSIHLQREYGKNINGSFHGTWSLGGIAGVGTSTLMVGFDVSLEVHFLVVTVCAAVAFLLAGKWLLRGDHAPSATKIKFGKPDPYILSLGGLVLLAAIGEGGMFDWSGVYFKEVVHVEVFTLGYLTFMIAMSGSRFLSDWVINRLGMKLVFALSSVTMLAGYLVAVIFPSFWPALIGFTLVGIGTAAFFPMIFTLAGQSKKYSAGMAISLVGTYSTIGFVAGPPFIGYLAHGFGLPASFVFLALISFMIFPVSVWVFRKFNIDQ